MRKTVLAFGEVLWDLLPSGAVLGGAPFNFAYRIHALGDRGVIVSRLGRDDLGRQAWARVVGLGVETAHIQWDDTHPTGTVHVSFDAQRNPDYLIVPGVAYDHIETTGALDTLAAAADCVCFGTLAQRAPTSRRTLGELLSAAPHAVKVLDINLRKECYTTESITASLERADVLKLNEDEAGHLARLFAMPEDSLPDFGARAVARWGLSCCVVTLGSRGALAVSGDGAAVYVPGYRVALVDSCGSGDAFTAGFVHRLLRGQDLRECCELGNALGALVATQPGATAPIAPDDIARLLAAGAPRVVEESLAELM
ncbi:MAG: carbohydrate kinase [Armatimonadetes bacterium]|nr:carbohydrate kinase [Armatimonadota bacterium]